jgi:steroid delta-isomerase-like uncharacterized protein
MWERRLRAGDWPATWSPDGRKIAFSRGGGSGTRNVVDTWTEAFNAHDQSQLHALNAEDVEFTGPGDVELKGADSVTEYAMPWLRAFPDSTLTAHTSLEDGEWAAQQFTFEGTHTETLANPQGDIPATNRRLDGARLPVVRVQGEKITEVHLYFDQMQVLTQLGLIPEAATTA